MCITENISNLLLDVKVGLTTGLMTVGASVGSVLEIIPDNIGKLGSVVGIILSLIVIYTHLKMGKIKYRKAQIELRLKQRDLNKLDDSKP